MPCVGKGVLWVPECRLDLDQAVLPTSASLMLDLQNLSFHLYK